MGAASCNGDEGAGTCCNGEDGVGGSGTPRDDGRSAASCHGDAGDAGSAAGFNGVGDRDAGLAEVDGEEG